MNLWKTRCISHVHTGTCFSLVSSMWRSPNNLFLTPGVETGPPGWKQELQTTRPHGTAEGFHATHERSVNVVYTLKHLHTPLMVSSYSAQDKYANKVQSLIEELCLILHQLSWNVFQTLSDLQFSEDLTTHQNHWNISAFQSCYRIMSCYAEL